MKCVHYWLKNSFADSSTVLGKKCHDFILSLMVFPYSNMCYFFLLFQCTPTEEILIDKHPVYANIVYACGFSGMYLLTQKISTLLKLPKTLKTELFLFATFWCHTWRGSYPIGVSHLHLYPCSGPRFVL